MIDTTVLTVRLASGGPAGAVYGFLFVWAGVAATFVVLSELASMYESSHSPLRCTQVTDQQGTDIRGAVSLVFHACPTIMHEAFQLYHG